MANKFIGEIVESLRQLKKSDLRRQGGLAVAAATEKRRAEMEVERRQDLGLIDSDHILLSRNYDIRNNTENNSVISEEDDSNDEYSDEDNKYNNNHSNNDNNKLIKIEIEMRKKSYIRSSVMNSLSEPLILTHDPVPLKLLTREELTLIAFKREKEKEKVKEIEKNKEKDKIREKEKRREREKQSAREREKWSVSETYEKSGRYIGVVCVVCLSVGMHACVVVCVCLWVSVGVFACMRVWCVCSSVCDLYGLYVCSSICVNEVI